jgi:hypothetical protein
MGTDIGLEKFFTTQALSFWRVCAWCRARGGDGEALAATRRPTGAAGVACGGATWGTTLEALIGVVATVVC